MAALVGRTVEDVTGDDDQVGPLLQQIVDGPPAGFCDVRLPLIRSPGRLPVELAEAQMQVSEVGKLHVRVLSTARPISG